MASCSPSGSISDSYVLVPRQTPISPKELFQAAQSGTLEALRKALAETNPLAQNDDGETALHIAAAHGHHEAFPSILSACRDLLGKTELSTRDGFAFLTSPALDMHDNRGFTPLHIAARRGDAPAVSALIQAGATVDSKDNQRFTPLYWAVFYGHDKVVSTLLQADADPNCDGIHNLPPLYWAAFKGFNSIAQMLLNKDAFIEPRDRNGDTPLLAAARYGHKDVVETLLQHKASLLARNNDGESVFHLAASRNHHGVLENLLNHLFLCDEDYAELNVKDAHGCTPLMRAPKDSKAETALLHVLQPTAPSVTASATPSSANCRGQHTHSERPRESVPSIADELGINRRPSDPGASLERHESSTHLMSLDTGPTGEIIPIDGRPAFSSIHPKEPSEQFIQAFLGEQNLALKKASERAAAEKYAQTAIRQHAQEKLDTFQTVHKTLSQYIQKRFRQKVDDALRDKPVNRHPEGDIENLCKRLTKLVLDKRKKTEYTPLLIAILDNNIAPKPPSDRIPTFSEKRI